MTISRAQMPGQLAGVRAKLKKGSRTEYESAMTKAEKPTGSVSARPRNAVHPRKRK